MPAGFRITSIALAGQRRLTREEILDTAGITGRSSLLFLDAAEARARLKANPWIAEATVLKLYPGRLHIAVTERDAFALWQRDGKVEVIADDGTVVEPYAGQHFAKLPLVVGVGAETRAKDFLALLDKYPAIRDQLHAAVLVAERRWNVMLKNGIDVRLPEAEVEQALDTLVKLDRDNKILSRDIAAIDLRLPDRVTVQLSDEAAAARAGGAQGQEPQEEGRRRMSLHDGFTPKMRPVSPRRSAIVAALDIGTSKIVCLIARLKPQGAAGRAAPAQPRHRDSRHRSHRGARHEGRRGDQSGGGRAGGAPCRRSRRARRFGAA